MLLLFFLIFFSINFLSSQFVVEEYSGQVYYRENSLSEWKALESIPFNVPNGGAVKTDEKSSVFIRLNNNSNIFLYEESALEVETISKYFVSLGLVYGKARFDINFTHNSNFVLKTLNSSFTSKRLIALFEADLYGKVETSIAAGECLFEYLIPHISGKRRMVLTQGMKFAVESSQKPYILGLIDDGIERELLSSEYLKTRKIEDRIEKNTKLYAFNHYSSVVSRKYFSDSIREKNSDFETGKTLRDVHGNIIRVEQRILRPLPNQIQFINMTKRPYYSDYSYSSDLTSNLSGFKYTAGAVENRIDLFALTFEFNKNLPSRVENLPSFFSDPAVNPVWMTVVAANITSQNCFFAAEPYKYLNSRGELVNNSESVGVPQTTNERDRDVILTGKILKKDLDDIINYNFVEKDLSSPTGELVKKTDNSQINGAFWGIKTGDKVDISGDIYRLRADKYLKGEDPSQVFWVVSETYLISSSGKIRKSGEIENDFNSVSDIARNNFIEGIVSIKQDDSSSPSDVPYLGLSDNIDVVISADNIYSSMENIFEAVKRWKD